MAAVLGRTALVAAAFGLAVVVALSGTAAWLTPTRPRLAARLAPWDARAAAAAAQSLIEAGVPPGDRGVAALVDRAIARDATMPAAIELRALRAGAGGEQAREARLFELSNEASRRSLPTRLWLIQHAVDRGDVAGALDDFDIALRTSAHAPPVLYPVLTRAIADPQLAASVARLLDRPGDWRLTFLNYAIAHDPVAAAGVVLAMHDRQVILDNHVDQSLSAGLVRTEAFPLARRVDDALRRPRGPVGEVRDPEFRDARAEYPFGWLLSDRGEVGAQRGLAGGAPALVYRATPGGEGSVASQLLVLAPGAYTLSTRTAFASSGEAAPVWTLTCAQASGRQIARLAQPAQRNGSASADVDVPSGCTGQWLTLNLRAADAEESGAVAVVTVGRRLHVAPGR